MIAYANCGCVPKASIYTVDPSNSCPTGLVHLALMGVYSCLMFPMEETINKVEGLINSMLSFLGIGNIGLVIINLVSWIVGAGHLFEHTFDQCVYLGPGFLH